MQDPPSSPDPTQIDVQARQGRRLRVWAMVVLVPVAVIGAALSFRSLYLAAVPVFGTRLALGFPLLVDFLILGASLQYVAGAKVGRPRAGWRWTAHAGVAGTLFLNAMAANTLREVPWHVTAPAVWSVLVELSAREVLGQWRAIHAPAGDRIPLRLWLTAPLESGRTWLRIARRVDGEHAAARLDVGVHAAAVEALKLALPQRRARRVRRILQRQLRAGSLPPSAILGPLGWMDADEALAEITPHAVLRAALRDTLRGNEDAGQLPAGQLPAGQLPAGQLAAGQLAAGQLAAGQLAARQITAGSASGTLSVAPVPLAPNGAVAPNGVLIGQGPLGADSTTEVAPTFREAVEADPFPVTGPETRPAPVQQNPVQQDPVQQDPVQQDRSGAERARTERARTERARVEGTRQQRQARQIREAVEEAVEVVVDADSVSTGDRFADAVEIVRVHESITSPQLATQLRGLGWELSDRTAGRILSDVRAHLLRLDPWALPMP
ncbi:MAG: hypothetical protein QG622_2311 [Actinomycetota bacterium]|nr:hypothetical protein [Actinomycetota bacterium]